MTHDHPHLFLVRLSGDLGTKARATATRFKQQLVRNLNDALACEGYPARVRLTRSRIFVESASPSADDVLVRVFGIQSVSRVEATTEGRIEELVERGLELFRERVRGTRFAVRARRVGDRSRIALDSQTVERQLGAALLPHARGVDLEDPETTIHVELYEERAFLFAERRPGPGGLPLGVEGRAVALVSGGFDSAVAAWHLQKRGVALDFVFCNLGGAVHEFGVQQVMKVIGDRWCYGTRPTLHAVDFRPLAAELQEKTERRYWQILLKRLMLRAAERIAVQCGAEALVTGEALGQVSSQTLTNLAVISQATTLPILRPLIGANKEEIIADARRIGTHDLSAVVMEYCGLVPHRPATAAAFGAIEREEAKIDLRLVDQALADGKAFDLRALELEKGALPALEVDSIPDDATLIDLRSRAAYDGWHYPDALYLDFRSALEAYRGFDRSQSYVLYCEFGLKSAQLAELMHREGFVAFNFRGGLKALVRYAEKQGVAATSLLGPAQLDEPSRPFKN